MNRIYAMMRNNLTRDRMSELMAIHLLGKELADGSAISFVKTLLTKSRPLQKSANTFSKTQLATWNLQ